MKSKQKSSETPKKSQLANVEDDGEWTVVGAGGKIVTPEAKNVAKPAPETKKLSKATMKAAPSAAVTAIQALTGRQSVPAKNREDALFIWTKSALKGLNASLDCKLYSQIFRNLAN